MERLGGRDWDLALMKYISDEVEKKTGVRIIDHDSYRLQLKNRAVEVKKKLSDGLSTTASARISMQDGRIISVPVSLSAFEEITYELMNRALECLKRVYVRNVSDHNIEEIICVGGSSNMLQVRRSITDAFPDMTVRLYEPEHAVVNGAAIYADLLSKLPHPHNTGDEITVISDVSSFSYGIKSYDRYRIDNPNNKKMIFNIVCKGDRLPATNQHTFNPIEDGQALVALTIYESDNPESKFDPSYPTTEIGTVKFPLPPGTTADYNIHCEISLHGDGFLYFEAKDDAGNMIPAQFKLSR